MAVNDASAEASAKAPLTKRMRETTHDVHETSDKLVNFKLAMVLTSKPLYAEAISLFWPIYRELERLLEKHKSHPALKQLYPLLPYLRRSPKFEEDMKFLLGGKQEEVDLLTSRRSSIGEDGNEEFSPPELQAYIDHLRKLSDDQPLLLIPYIYSMYGAILAGGSIIKRMVRGAFSLNDDRGVSMFVVALDGSQFKNILEFRNAMRKTLDEETSLTPEEEELILAEAPKVFQRNNSLVATVKDSQVFMTVWKRCQNYAVLGVSVAIAILAAARYSKW